MRVLILTCLALAASAPCIARQLSSFDPPLVTRGQVEKWSVRFRVDAFAVEEIDRFGEFPHPRRFDLERVETVVDRATLYVPVIGRTASSEPLYDADSIERTLRWDTRDQPDGYQIMAGPCTDQDRYAQFALEDLEGSVLTFMATIEAECWETRYDEDRAMEIGWPSEWPQSVRSALDAGEYVNSDASEVRDLVRRWTGGATRAVAPAMLAKTLAKGVIDHVQIAGSQFIQSSHGRLAAMNVQGAQYAAREGKGSEEDLVALFVATCRAAGLPARLVVGVDVEASQKQSYERFHTWAEFFLYDESLGAGEWIPVDLARQKRFSSRAPAVDRPWPYFGSSDELDVTLPLAFHFAPPTLCVVYRGPALWGWLPQPNVPVMDQDLTMTFSTPVQRGG